MMWIAGDRGLEVGLGGGDVGFGAGATPGDAGLLEVGGGAAAVAVGIDEDEI